MREGSGEGRAHAINACLSLPARVGAGLPRARGQHLRVQHRHGHHHPFHPHLHQPEPPHRLLAHPYLRNHQPAPPRLHKDNPGPQLVGGTQDGAGPQEDQSGKPFGAARPRGSLPHPGLGGDRQRGEDVQVGTTRWELGRPAVPQTGGVQQRGPARRPAPARPLRCSPPPGVRSAP